MMDGGRIRGDLIACIGENVRWTNKRQATFLHKGMWHAWKAIFMDAQLIGMVLCQIGYLHLSCTSLML